MSEGKGYRQGGLCFRRGHVYNEEAYSPIVGHYRLRAEHIPREVCLSEDIGEENMSTLSEYLTAFSGTRVTVRHPERGKLRELCETVKKNAEQRAKDYKTEAERDETTLAKLASMLMLETVPQRIEAYDISNFGADNKTAGMIVIEDGKFKKSDYRVFSIKIQRESMIMAFPRGADEGFARL